MKARSPGKTDKMAGLGNAPGRGHAYFQLRLRAPSLRSAAEARRWFDEWCHSNLTAEVCRDAELVLSELVTNAIRYAPGSIEIEGRTADGVLRLGVTDESTRPLGLIEPDPEATGGRGLQLVDALAASWGSHLRADGKEVWAELA